MSDTASVMPEHPPVSDWVNDFDHTDPRWTNDPFPIWDELRNECPVVHTKRFLGCYLPTTYQAVKEIAYDTEHFSSRRVIVRDVRPPITNTAPPITSDPPEHKPAKQLLLPPFTPDAMKKLEPRVRAICNELIDEFIADGKCDAAARYTKHIPVRAIAHMLGIPEKDGDLFIKWIHEILELGIKDDAALMRAVHEMTALFRRTYRGAEEESDRRSDLDHDERQGQGRPAAVGHACARLAAAAADRRDRHHLERDRLLAVASGEDAGRPRPPDRRAGTDANRDRGIPAGLFAGDDGARSDRGNHHQRLPGQARQHGAAVVPGRQPRPGDVPRRRQGADRPQGKPPRRLRPRHSPLRRLQPRAHGDDGRDRGMAEADSGFQARSGRRGQHGRKAPCAVRASFRCCSRANRREPHLR